MSKRWRWVVLLCLTILAVSMLFYPAVREPRYRGRLLSEWLEVCYTAGLPAAQRDEAVEAFRHFDTKALPFLLSWIDYERPKTKQIALHVFNHLQRKVVPRRLYAWAELDDGRERRANKARFGFLILGSRAAPAIPDLVRLANQGNSLAVSALGGIGPDAIPELVRLAGGMGISALGDMGPQAFPALLAIISNTNALGRNAAIAALANFGTNALPAVQILTAQFDPDGNEARHIAYTLGQLHLNPEASVPVLMRCLKSRNPDVRNAGAYALADFGNAAQPAVAELTEMEARDPEFIVQQIAHQTLKRIDAQRQTNR